MNVSEGNVDVGYKSTSIIFGDCLITVELKIVNVTLHTSEPSN